MDWGVNCDQAHLLDGNKLCCDVRVAQGLVGVVLEDEPAMGTLDVLVGRSVLNLKNFPGI